MKRGKGLKRGRGLSKRGARAKRDDAALQAFREAVLERAGGRCELCGLRVRQALHAHHVVSRARGAGWPGLHDPNNGKALCGACHHRVHSAPDHFPEFIKSPPRGQE